MNSFSYPTSESFNFGGLTNQDYKKARVAVLLVPYESTTYYKSGTKSGPQAIIEASRHMELYDLDRKKAIKETDIFTLDELEPSKNLPKEMIIRIRDVVDRILEDKKAPFILGGEHSITTGPVLALKNKGFNFSVLQIDAHSDLRDEFQDTKYHHGCVMRRVRNLIPSVVQVGIRSMSPEEAEYVESKKINNIFYKKDGLPVEKIISSLKENVYLTFDLDALDPSIMPSVGTPEPGGFMWDEIINFLEKLGKERNIIGADVVELSPIPGLIGPDFLAARLVYKIIGLILDKKYVGPEVKPEIKPEIKQEVIL
ncbi:MAG: agmatinase [Candidatus Nealsonbacteria bacterium]|nr:agmatinase [Candidatus Nealsonbacteria bacterium]